MEALRKDHTLFSPSFWLGSAHCKYLTGTCINPASALLSKGQLPCLCLKFSLPDFRQSLLHFSFMQLTHLVPKAVFLARERTASENTPPLQSHSQTSPCGGVGLLKMLGCVSRIGEGGQGLEVGAWVPKGPSVFCLPWLLRVTDTLTRGRHHCLSVWRKLPMCSVGNS